VHHLWTVHNCTAHSLPDMQLLPQPTTLPLFRSTTPEWGVTLPAASTPTRPYTPQRDRHTSNNSTNTKGTPSLTFPQPTHLPGSPTYPSTHCLHQQQHLRTHNTAHPNQLHSERLPAHLHICKAAALMCWACASKPAASCTHADTAQRLCASGACAPGRRTEV
jgi:hypothetical protein